MKQGYQEYLKNKCLGSGTCTGEEQHALVATTGSDTTNPRVFSDTYDTLQKKYDEAQLPKQEEEYFSAMRSEQAGLVDKCRSPPSNCSPEEISKLTEYDKNYGALPSLIDGGNDRNRRFDQLTEDQKKQLRADTIKDREKKKDEANKKDQEKLKAEATTRDQNTPPMGTAALDQQKNRTYAACASAALFTALAVWRGINLGQNRSSAATSCKEIKRLFSDSDSLLSDSAATNPNGSASPSPIDTFAGSNGSGSAAAGAAGSASATAGGATGEATATADFTNPEAIAQAQAAMASSKDGQAFEKSGLSRALPPGLDPVSLASSGLANNPATLISKLSEHLSPGGQIAQEMGALASGLESNPGYLKSLFSRSSGISTNSAAGKDLFTPLSSYAPTTSMYGGSSAGLFNSNANRQPGALDYSRKDPFEKDDIYHSKTGLNIFQVVSEKYQRVDSRVR